MNENICLSCGKCCSATEMLLSEQDINLILENYDIYRTKNDFSFTNQDGFHQLKNIDGHCLFFNESSNKCEIYDSRPQGCRFYPLIYDSHRKKCIFDRECPHPRHLYQNHDQIKLNCESLKKFLKTQLNIRV